MGFILRYDHFEITLNPNFSINPFDASLFIETIAEEYTAPFFLA